MTEEAWRLLNCSSETRSSGAATAEASRTWVTGEKVGVGEAMILFFFYRYPVVNVYVYC